MYNCSNCLRNAHVETQDALHQRVLHKTLSRDINYPFSTHISFRTRACLFTYSSFSLLFRYSLDSKVTRPLSITFRRIVQTNSKLLSRSQKKREREDRFLFENLIRNFSKEIEQRKRNKKGRGFFIFYFPSGNRDEGTQKRGIKFEILIKFRVINKITRFFVYRRVISH